MVGVFSTVNEDVIQNILSRLPALSFASAACVNKSWNKVCSRILSRPKLASALSLNPCLPDAVKEVLMKVLSEPIRPDYAIACIGKQFCLELTHRLIVDKLGSKIPIVTNAASGIIGVDVVTNEVKEVQWEVGDNNDSDSQEHDMPDWGIALVVGFVPGLKVGSIPLLRPMKHQAPQPPSGLEYDMPPVEKFMMDIKSYADTVSDCACPACIILFGDKSIDMKPIIEKMDCELPEETVIVGASTGCFLSTSGADSQKNLADMYFFDAVALVFTRDGHQSQGVGETQFHVALSTGLMPFGPELEAVDVMAKDSECSWLTARMKGHHHILDGQGLLDDFVEQFDEDEDIDDIRDVYIGVLQQRQRCNGSKRLRSGTSLTLYDILGADNAFFVVNGVGIKAGDSILFYHSDSETASSSRSNIYEDIASLKIESKCQKQTELILWDNGDKKEVFGGFIFSCFIRGKPLSEQDNAYSYPFSENFPGVPVGGLFCHREIGRAPATCLLSREENEENSPYCSLRVYSTVYLVMTYSSVPSEIN